MKNTMFKRSLAFLMSALMVFGTFASDLTKLTASAVGSSGSDATIVASDNLSSETYVNGTKITKSATVAGDQITFTFKVDGSTTQQKEETTEYTKTDVVFVMDLSNSMITSKNETVLTCTKTEHTHKTKGNNKCTTICGYSDYSWSHTHSASCYSCGMLEHKHSNYSCYTTKTVTTDRLTPAKNAAKSFTEKLLADELKDYVRVGVASFGTKAHTESGLSNNKATVLSKIDAIDLEKTKYGESGGTNIQAGLATAQSMLASSTAQNKYIVILSDGVPTYAAQGSGTGKSVTLNNGDKITLYNSLGSTIIGEGNAISDNVYKSTLTQAYKAKDAGISVFAIAYDLSNSDSKTMVNVATANTSDASYFFNASSTTNDVASSISNVMAGIAKQIEESVGVASAQDIVIDDTLPSYIKFNAGQDVAGVEFDADLGGFKMEIGSPIAGQTVEKTVTATISMSEMITYYASTDDFADEAAVRAQMAKPEGLAVSLNGNVVITFNDENGKPQDPNTDIKIDSEVEGAEVPTKIFHSYPYSVKFTVDGKDSEVPTVSGFAYEGEEITITIPDGLLDSNTYKPATGMPEGGKFTVSATESNDYVINVDHKIYTVTFKNSDGTQLSSKEYFYGATVEEPETPVKSGDVQYNYTFSKWTPELTTTVTESKEYTAEYTQNVNTYVVEFVNADGTVLQTETLEYGSLPVYKGETPTKTETESKTFVFAGHWDKEITPVTGNETYTARYNEIDKIFTVVFKDADGTVIKSSELKYGEKVVAPANPTKAEDATYTYEFDGWTPDVVLECKGNATYTATYKGTYKNYTVTFIVDNTVVSEKTDYHYGDKIVVPADPTKAADETNTYTFAGWEGLTETVEGNTTVTAKFDSTKIEYTVIFYKDAEKTEVLSTATYHYGDKIVVPADPEKAAAQDEAVVYKFAGWSPAVALNCAGNAEYVPTFNEVNLYTITFMNEEVVVASFTVEAGTDITDRIPDAPAKAADKTNTYTFTGWDKTVDTTANASVVYYAQFAATPINYTITFKVVEDGQTTVVSTKDDYHFGQEVTVPSVTRENTAEWTYSVGSWTPSLSYVCAGDAEYTITVSKTKNSYTVIFKDWNGTEISSQEVEYGNMPEIPNDPTREQDERNTYEFIGWDVTPATVTENAEYTAQYEASTRYYTIKFVDDNDEELTELTLQVPYEAQISVPAVPEKAATAEFVYFTNGWAPEVVTIVTADATYKAQYTFEKNEYTITFNNDNGKLIEAKTYKYGDTPVAPVAIKEADNEYTYSFKTWTPEIKTVVGDATYTAVFDKADRLYTVTFIGANGVELDQKTCKYGMTVEAPVAAAPTGMHFTSWDKDFSSVKEDITVTAQFDFNTYRAGFYVVKPDRLASIKAEPEGIVAGMVAQSSSDYIDTKIAADFKYIFAPNKTVGEYFGAHKTLLNDTAETTVENIFGSALPTVGTLTYVTEKGNTLKLSNFDWYVIKNANNSTGSTGWHVDGYAQNVELVAPEVKPLDYVIKYTGAVRNDYVAARVAEDIAALSTEGKTYTVDEVLFGRDIQNVDTTYTAKAYVEYTSEGLTAKTEVDVTVTVVAVDAVVTVKGTAQEVTYDGTEQTVDVKYEVSIEGDESYDYSEADFEFTGAATVSGKDAGVYSYGLSADDFTNKNANVNVTFKVADADLTIKQKEVVYSVENLTKVYADEDPELSLVFDGVVEGDVIDYTIFREEGENVGLYDVYVVFGSRQMAVPFAAVEEETDEVVYANSNYVLPADAVVVGKFEITKRPVIVRAFNASKEYGAADPSFTAVAINDVKHDFAAWAWRDPGEIAGARYLIHASYSVNEKNADNYAVTVENAVLTIGEYVPQEVPPTVGPTPTPTPAPTPAPNPTPVTPTPVPEEEEEVVPPVEETVIVDEPTPEAPSVPEVVVDDNDVPTAPEVVIEPEETPLAAGHCWIHWLLLADAIIFAAYAALRGVANARELKESVNSVEE